MLARLPPTIRPTLGRCPENRRQSMRMGYQEMAPLFVISLPGTPSAMV
jgi:hypothetical protein